MQSKKDTSRVENIKSELEKKYDEVILKKELPFNEYIFQITLKGVKHVILVNLDGEEIPVPLEILQGGV